MKELASVVGLVLLSFSCGSPERPPTTPMGGGSPVRGGTVVIGLLSDIQSWNPYLVEDLDTEHLLSLVYPSLAIEQTDYHIHPPSFEPALARSWSWSDDHLVLTLELDPDARWSDGVPITADDVVFTWQVQTSIQIDWLYSDGKDFIASVEAADEDTVRVTFTHTYPYQFMDLNDGLIIPAHAWAKIPFEEWAATDWKERSLAGGPFRLVGHTPQQEIVLERNPLFYRSGLPYLDRLVFRIVPSEQGLMTQLVAGEIDFIRSVEPAALERIRNHDNLELVIYDDRSYTHICWNTQKPHLATSEVRTALSTAIDRETLIDVVYGGFGRVGVGPVLSSFWAFNRELEALPFDPTTAREILAEAGWTDSDGDGLVDRDGEALGIELLVSAENELRQDLAILIQEDLKRIGVKVELRFLEWGTLMAAMQGGEFDALINLWEEPTQIDLDGLWHSVPPDEPTFNFGRYANPDVDRLLSEVAELTDFAEQKHLYDQVQEIIVADQPYTFLIENTRLTAHSSRIRGAEVNSATPYFNTFEWFVTTKREDE